MSDFKFKTPCELQEKSNGANAWIIDRLVPRDSCCLVAGSPKTRKSWFVYELLVSISTGTPAFGYFDSAKAGVMLVQGEDSESIIRERLSLISETRGFHSDQIENVNILAGHPFHLDNPEHFKWLELQVNRARPSLLILDPF